MVLKARYSMWPLHPGQDNQYRLVKVKVKVFISY